jgi:hypothetical protein
MIQKYKLGEQDEETRLYRIIALCDIPRHDIKAGDIGGLIESEENLTQKGDAWVGGDARVFGNARVSECALISDRARVFGNALVTGHAKVVDEAWVFDDARIWGFAKIYAESRISGNARIGEGYGSDIYVKQRIRRSARLATV